MRTSLPRQRQLPTALLICLILAFSWFYLDRRLSYHEGWNEERISEAELFNSPPPPSPTLRIHRSSLAYAEIPSASSALIHPDGVNEPSANQHESLDFHSPQYSSILHPLPSTPSSYPASSSVLSNNAPIVGLINIWHGPRLSPYITVLFHTVSLDPHTLSLLFINIDTGTGCAELTTGNFMWPNIHSICLSQSDFFNLIADFLCSEDFWSCSSEQRRLIRRVIPEKGDEFAKSHESTYRPLVPAATKHLWPNGSPPNYLGFADTDIMFGNATRFREPLKRGLGGSNELPDIMTFSVRGIDGWLLYMRGQMTLFRTDAIVQVARAYLQSEELADPESWMELFETATEEGLWSSMLLDAMSKAGSSAAQLRWVHLVGVQGGDQSMAAIEESKSVYSQVLGTWEIWKTKILSRGSRSD